MFPVKNGNGQGLIVGLLVLLAERKRRNRADHAGHIHEGSIRKLLHPVALGHEVGKHIVEGLRLAEVVALNLVAADLLEEEVLVLGLDPFRHCSRTQVLCHRHKARYYYFRLVREVAEELHVNLDRVKVEIFQDIERRVPGPEIVHPDRIAQGLELVHIFPDLRRLGKYGLRNLDMEKLPGHTVAGHDFIDGRHHVHDIEIPAGEVHGHRNEALPGIRPFPVECADLLQHIEVQAGYQVVVLENRYEEIGTDHAPLRVVPPGQALHAAEIGRHGPHHRLEVNLNPPVL